MSCVSGSIPRLVFGEVLLFLSQLFDPNIDQSLQFSSCQVCERSIFPGSERLCTSVVDIRGFQQMGLEFQTFSKLFRKTSELVRSSERAKDDEDLLPLLQFSILYNVA